MKASLKLAIGAALGVGVVFATASLAQARMPVAERERVKNVSGVVIDQAEAPISGAVVYLKNTKTLAVKSFITNEAGQFRFNALSPNTDYELYAEFNANRSGTKTVSSFDSKTEVNMTLKVDVKR
jgi:hypothetical protein